MHGKQAELVALFDVPHRTTPEHLLPGPDGALVSIDYLPEAYATAHVEVVTRYDRYGVEARVLRLHRPSLLPCTSLSDDD